MISAAEAAFRSRRGLADGLARSSAGVILQWHGALLLAQAEPPHEFVTGIGVDSQLLGVGR
jgi:hypothetical protein